MSDPSVTKSKTRKSSGKFLPALCNTLGILLILAVILVALPLTVPRLFHYDIYNIVSPSMEPELPVGSIVYTKYLPPEEVRTGDIIAFLSNGSVVTHRIVRNRIVEGDYITKGDANSDNDPDPVSYGALIGTVRFHLPYLGALLSILTTLAGKIYLFLLALSGYLFTVLARRLRLRSRRVT